MIQGWKQSGNPRHHPITVNDRRYDDLCHISRHRCLNQSLGRPGMHEHKVGPSPWHQSFKYFTPFWCKYQAFHDDRSLCRFKIEFGAELRKPLPTPTDLLAWKERFNKNIEGGPRPTMKKTYRYIPHEQGRESDPIFHLSRGAPMSNSPNVVIPVDATKAERRGKMIGRWCTMGSWIHTPFSLEERRSP